MRNRAKSYLWFLKLDKFIPAAIRTPISNIWLGFLEPRDLADITLGTYEGASGFETAAHNLSGLLQWEEAAVSAHFTGCGRILVAGAGAGREVIALARCGFDVVGFDATKDLVDAGSAHLASIGLSATILHAEAGDTPSGIGQFDGLMIGRGAYHHIPGASGRVNFLRTCTRHLRENAPVLIGDFLLRSPTQKGARRASTIAAAINRMRRSTFSIAPGDILHSGFFHRFLPEEIRDEMNRAGLELVQFERTPGNEEGLGSAVGRRSPAAPTASLSAP